MVFSLIKRVKIEAAEKQREDSDAKLKEYNDIISKSKLEANSIFNQAREKH